MMNLDRILLATDFSPYANEARRYACELANQFHAELHVLNVIDDIYLAVPDFGMGLAFPAFVENLPARREKLELDTMKKLSAQMSADFEKSNRVVIATRFGAPFLEILTYAKENVIDLIVLGTHGRTGMQHVLMGSVAENVVRKSPCPVLTIRPSGFDDIDTSKENMAARTTAAK